jgi:phosphoserine aminotransferase
MLPLEVLQKAGAELTDAGGTGQSVMELSHRSKDFKPIIERTEALLREVLGLPPHYKVLFLQGGASLQFAMVPINLAASDAAGAPGASGPTACYVDTGVWASKAAAEGAKYCRAEVRASSKDRNYTYIPAAPAPAPGDAFYHITLNNTITGTMWDSIPDTGAVPLAADVSSCILSEPLDVSRFGLLYAGAQKNLGPAGLTLVIIREDLIGRAPAWAPAMLRYDIHAAEGSMYNTPPCWCIYMTGLVLEWAAALGGLPALAERNKKKAALLYGYLEKSRLFRSPVEKPYRSLMNVPFLVNESDADKRKAIETRFLSEAAAAGLVNLAGHRLVGGLRASIYNAMPLEGVAALVNFAEAFEKNV